VPELEKQPKGFIQAETADAGFRIQEPQGNCPELWTLGRSFPHDVGVTDLTLMTSRYKRRKRRSSPNSSLLARVQKQNTSSEAWKANFELVTPRSLFWFLSPMPLFWRRKKRVRWVESQPNSCFAKDLLAGKRWSQEKLTEKLEEGSNILKSVYRYVEGRLEGEGASHAICLTANCLPMTWSSPSSSSLALEVSARSVSSLQECLLSPCLRSLPRLSEKCWIGLRIRSSPANTNTTANVPR